MSVGYEQLDSGLKQKLTNGDVIGPGAITESKVDPALLAKIYAYADAIKTSLLGGADTAFDTLKELETALNNDPSAVVNLLNKIGALSSLTTNNKSNLVSAINEVKSNNDTALNEIGNLSSLSTTTKTTIVLAINEVLTDIGGLSSLTTTTKANIVSAINEVLTDIGGLSSLTTASKTNIVIAINELVTKMGALTSLNTTAKTNLVSAINEIKSSADTALNEIGTLSNLGTANKSNIVSSINEVLSDINNVNSTATSASNNANTALNEIGTLGNLSTGNKSNVVGAINEVFQSGVDAKSKVVNAITTVGGTANTGMVWDDIANTIINSLGSDPFYKYDNNTMWHSKLYGNFNAPILIVQNDSLYIMGGATNYVLDIRSKTLTSLADKPTKYYLPSAALYNNKIYCSGGVNSSNGTAAFEIYDIASNTWSIGPSLPSPRFSTTSYAYNNKVYVFGGTNWDGNTFACINDIICYDIWSNTWSTIQTGVSLLNVTRSISGGTQTFSHTSTQKDNLVYIISAATYGVIGLFDMSNNTLNQHYASLSVYNTNSHTVYPVIAGDTMYVYAPYSDDNSYGFNTPGGMNICPSAPFNQPGDSWYVSFGATKYVPLDYEAGGAYISRAGLAQYKGYILVGFDGIIWVFKM